MEFPKRYEDKYQELVSYLQGVYEAVGSYKKLAEFMDNGVSPSYYHQILHYGYRPTGGKNADKLGLPKIKLVPRIVLDRPKRKYTKRVRIDIDPNTDAVTIGLIRDMDIETRTAALRAFAFTEEAKEKEECQRSPMGYHLYRSDGDCTWCGHYDKDMDHRSEEEKNG